MGCSPPVWIRPELEDGSQVYSNICDQKLGGKLVVNQCFYHLYFFINPLSTRYQFPTICAHIGCQQCS
jgi:hypothetical protein